jgi:sec-independent protein translocase protein TatB
MFDIGWTEITVILIIAIIVIGPKDLPRVMRTVGEWVGKAKAMTREFRGHVDDMVRDTELSELKNDIDSVGSLDANTLLENSIDAEGEIKNALDFSGDEFANPVGLDDSSYIEDNPVNFVVDSTDEKSEDPDGFLDDIARQGRKIRPELIKKEPKS